MAIGVTLDELFNRVDRSMQNKGLLEVKVSQELRLTIEKAKAAYRDVMDSPATKAVEDLSSLVTELEQKEKKLKHLQLVVFIWFIKLKQINIM